MADSTNYENTSNRYVVLMRARQMLEEMIAKNLSEQNPDYMAEHREMIENLINRLTMPLSFMAEIEKANIQDGNKSRSLENEFSVLQIYETLFDPKQLNQWAKVEAKKQGVNIAEVKNNFEYKFKYALYKNAIETKEILNFGDKDVILGSGGQVDLEKDNAKLETLVSTYCSNLESVISDVVEVVINQDPLQSNNSYLYGVKYKADKKSNFVYKNDEEIFKILQELIAGNENGLSNYEIQACYSIMELMNNAALTKNDKENYSKIIIGLDGTKLDSTCLNSIEVVQKTFVREIEKIRINEDLTPSDVATLFNQALGQMQENFREIESFKDAEVADKAIVSYKSNIAEAYLDKHIQSEEERVITINKQSTETDMLYFALYKASNVSTHDEFERLVEQMKEYEEVYDFSDNARNAITKVFNTKVPNEDALLSDEKYRIDYAERSVNEFFTFTSQLRPTHKKYVKELERGLSGHLSYASKLDKVKQREKEQEDSKDKEETNSQDNAYQYDELVDLSPLFDENNELLQEELKKEQEKARQQQIDNVVYSSWELINKIDAEKVGDDEYADAIGAKENEFQQLIETFTNLTKPKETQLVEIYGDKYEKATESEKQALEIEARSTHKLQELNDSQKQKYIEKIESSKQELENDRRIAYTGGLFTNYDGTTLSEENIQLLGGVRRLCNEINKDFAQEDPRCKKLIEDAKKLKDIKGFYAKQCESKEKQLENLFGDDYINATDEDKLKMEEGAISSHRVFVYNDGQRIEVLVNIENAFKDLEKAKNDLESQLNKEAEVDIDYDFKNPDGTPLSEENRAFFDGVKVLIAEMKASGLYGLSSINKMTDEEYKNASNVEKFRVMAFNFESALKLYNQTSLTREEHLIRIYGEKYLNENDQNKKDDMVQKAIQSGELVYSLENTSLAQRESMLAELQKRSNDLATIYYHLLTDNEQQNITPRPSPAPSPNPTPSPMPNPSAEEESSKEDDKPKKENKKVAKSKGPEYETSVQTGRLSTFLKKPGVINSIRATGVFLAIMTVVFFVTGAWIPALLLTATLSATFVADVTYTRKLKEAQEAFNEEVKELVKDAVEAGATQERLRTQQRELENVQTTQENANNIEHTQFKYDVPGYQYDKLENLDALFDENNELLEDYIKMQGNVAVTSEDAGIEQNKIESNANGYVEEKDEELSREERAERLKTIKQGMKDGLSDKQIEENLRARNSTDMVEELPTQVEENNSEKNVEEVPVSVNEVDLTNATDNDGPELVTESQIVNSGENIQDQTRDDSMPEIVTTDTMFNSNQNEQEAQDVPEYFIEMEDAPVALSVSTDDQTPTRLDEEQVNNGNSLIAGVNRHQKEGMGMV